LGKHFRYSNPPQIRPLLSKVAPLTRPPLTKATPLVRSDFRYAERIKYYLTVPLSAIVFIAEGVSL